jgi:hypothetical protein
MINTRISKTETRILCQCWKLGTSSVREILESLPESERVAYTTAQSIVHRLERKGALRKVRKSATLSCSILQSTWLNIGAPWFETCWIYSADPPACCYPIFSKTAPSRAAI